MSDKIMTEQDWEELETLWVRSIQPLIKARKLSEAIDLVRTHLEGEAKLARRLYLLHELTSLLIVDSRDDEALAVIRQRIELDPEDPLNWHGLASWHFYGKGTYDADEEALRQVLAAIDMAVEKARVRGDLRFALNDRCRIAIALKRYDLLEESLREILAMPPDAPGIQLEGEFLSRVPDGAIDQALLERYRAALAEQAARRARRRPPE